MTADALYPEQVDGATVHRVGRENSHAVWQLDLTTLDRSVATAWLLGALGAADSVNGLAVLTLNFANGVSVDLPWKHRRWLPVASLADQLRADEDVVDWLRGWALSTTGDGSPIERARGRATAVNVNVRRGTLAISPTASET